MIRSMIGGRCIIRLRDRREAKPASTVLGRLEALRVHLPRTAATVVVHGQRIDLKIVQAYASFHLHREAQAKFQLFSSA